MAPPQPQSAPMVQAPKVPSVAASTLPSASARPTELTVAAMIGWGYLDSDRIRCNCGTVWSTEVGELNEIEITHSGSSFSIGGTLVRARERAEGLALGWQRLVRPWFRAESGATVGLWSIKNTGVEDSTDLFVRLSAGLAFSPTSWLDIVSRLSVIHPMSGNQYLGYISIGLRYRLPL